MENQVLEKRYVDKKRLGDLLKKLFPQGGFQVEVRTQGAFNSQSLRPS